MRIIIIGPAHPFRGGIADTNESFCRSLIAKKHDASIITFKLQYPGFLFPGKTQYTTESKPKDIVIDRWINTINPINWVLMARKINSLKPDMVIVRYWLPFFAPCLGFIARKLNKQITLIAMCDNIIPHEKRFGDKMLTRYFFKAFKGFITLSQATHDELSQFTDKPKRYFPHPINTNLGEKVPQKEARSHLELDVDGKYLLFFGLIRKYKGLDLTLKAFGESKIKELNVKLLVVGEFYDSRDKYNDLINKYDLKEHVKIIDEFIPTSDIKYYFSAADMVIQTYHTASQSGITQIAYNFDCPILVTDVGGLAEVIPHKEVGYVSEKDPAKIAEYIVDFFTNERRDLFIKNIQSEKHKYSWDSFTNEIINLYQEITTANNG